MSLLIGNTPERIYIPHKENAAIACDMLNVSADTLVLMNEQGGKSICCLESQTPDRMLLYAFLWQDCLGRSTTKRRKKYLWTSGLPRNHRLPQLSQGRNVPVSAGYPSPKCCVSVCRRIIRICWKKKIQFISSLSFLQFSFLKFFYRPGQVQIISLDKNILQNKKRH